jgi:hypothetical protein
MDVTATFNNLKEEQQTKFEFNTEMYDKFKALKFKLRMWGNKVKLHNIRHFPRLKSLHAIFPQLFKNITRTCLLRSSMTDKTLRIYGT